MLNHCFKFSQLAAVPQAWVRAYADVGSDAAYAESISPAVGKFNRASVDALAAWHKWSLKPVPDWAPGSIFWLEVLWRARAEALAARDLVGMKSNLADLNDLVPIDPVARPLYLASRRFFSGASGLGDSIYSDQLSLSSAPSFAGTTFLGRLFRLGPTSAPPPDPTIAQALASAAARLLDEQEFIASLEHVITSLADWYVPRDQVQGISKVTKLLGSNTQLADSPALSDSEHLSPESEIKVTPLPYASSDKYAIYSSSLDETEPASKWLRQLDIEDLGRLDQPRRRDVRRLAHQLQRRLQAARLRHWSFDQEEGHLDSRRLSRLIGDRPDPRIFRFEREGFLQNACVCMLVDQSGSMRGSRQRMAALAIDLAVHTLETVGICCEVLGYTTRFQGDSPVKQHWDSSGQPPRPGRLNALRHIIFKKARQPWRGVRKNLGLLLRKNFGKENLDGEAILWAGRRLLGCRERNKVLIVLSDGTPFDRATVDVMGRDYLEIHLRQAIAASEAQGIRVMAIGTDQSVGAFYQTSVTVRAHEQIPEALMESLSTALLGQGRRCRR